VAKSNHITRAQLLKTITKVAGERDDVVLGKDILEQVWMVECMKKDPAKYSTLETAHKQTVQRSNGYGDSRTQLSVEKG